MRLPLLLHMERWFWNPELYRDRCSVGKEMFARTGSFYDVQYDTPPAIRYYEYRRVDRLIGPVFFSRFDPMYDWEGHLR
jgi:hypothetical protein